MIQRAQRLRAGAISAFVHVSPFDTKGQHYANSSTAGLDRPTRDSGVLVKCAVQGLERIYRDGFAYQRAGVLLPDLASERVEQGTLFTDMPTADGRADRLMDALDRINRAQGRGVVHFAGEGLGGRWRMRQRLKSAGSSTSCDGVPAVR